MSDHVQLDAALGVLTVRMNRPEKKNALDRAMYRAMAEAFARAEADDSVGAVLVLGHPGAFTAGNDIRDFLDIASGGEFGIEVGDFLNALASGTKPVVAGVDGIAIGIGTTMLMHCDLVYATPTSLFRTPFLDLGLVPEAGSSLIAPRLMGQQRAMALLALGESFDAEAARQANLVYAVVAAADLEARAGQAATALAAKPREALRIARELVRGPRAEILQRIELESRYFRERLSSSEARAAFQAFLSR